MDKFAVIFDMDGVIVDTNPYHTKAFKAFFDKYELDFDEADFVEHMYGKHNSYIFKHFFKRPIIGEELLQFENEKEASFREIYKNEIQPLTGFSDFLSTLKDAGIKTGVATSAPRANLDLIAKHLGLASQMDSLLGSEDVNQHKPHPEVYLSSAKNIGLEPSHCLVFEDSHAGVSAAIAAGCKVVGVLTSHDKMDLPPCDDYIDDFTEITLAKAREILQD